MSDEARERSEFEKKGVDEDIINLRYKHYQNRLIDILNRVLDERRRISKLTVMYCGRDRTVQRGNQT